MWMPELSWPRRSMIGFFPLSGVSDHPHAIGHGHCVCIGTHALGGKASVDVATADVGIQRQKVGCMQLLPMAEAKNEVLVTSINFKLNLNA
jgi:hypothetical protein